MLTATEIAGFAGAGLAGAAYVPQISHLVRARCSAGISRLAFEAWLLASVLTTARAIAIGAGVFIVLGGIQIVATALIMLCAIRYKDTPCLVHLPRPPAAKSTGQASLVPGVRPRRRGASGAASLVRPGVRPAYDVHRPAPERMPGPSQPPGHRQPLRPRSAPGRPCTDFNLRN